MFVSKVKNSAKNRTARSVRELGETKIIHLDRDVNARAERQRILCLVSKPNVALMLILSFKVQCCLIFW